MRKILYLVPLILFALLLPKTTQADSPHIIASCTNATGEQQLTANPLYETFVPGVNRISGISIRTRSFADDTYVTYGISATTNTSDPLISFRRNPNVGYENLDQTFSAITVNPSQTYYLFAQYSSGGPSVFWQASDSDCYNGGSARGDPEYADYYFSVTGYNFSSSPSGSTPPGSTPPSGGTGNHGSSGNNQNNSAGQNKNLTNLNVATLSTKAAVATKSITFPHFSNSLKIGSLLFLILILLILLLLLLSALLIFLVYKRKKKEHNTDQKPK